MGIKHNLEQRQAAKRRRRGRPPEKQSFPKPSKAEMRKAELALLRTQEVGKKMPPLTFVQRFFIALKLKKKR